MLLRPALATLAAAAALAFASPADASRPDGTPVPKPAAQQAAREQRAKATACNRATRADRIADQAVAKLTRQLERATAKQAELAAKGLPDEAAAQQQRVATTTARLAKAAEKATQAETAKTTICA